jgi:hypothetical protein
MPGRSRDSLRPNGQNKPVSDLRLGSRRGRPGPRIPSDVILTSLDVESRGRQLAAGAVGPALWPASAASSAVVSWRRRSASAATGWLQLSSKYSRAPRHQQASPMFAYLLEVRQLAHSRWHRAHHCWNDPHNGSQNNDSRPFGRTTACGCSATARTGRSARQRLLRPH